MHERRDLIVVIGLLIAMSWTLFAWLVAPDYIREVPPGLIWHQVGATSLLVGFGAYLVYIRVFTDKLDDELAKVTGGVYYERDGLCFMPLVRRNSDGEHAEISLYYQNRYASPAEAVIHLRPRCDNVAVATHAGAKDIHFAFIAPPGGFGVIHQPVAVCPKFQGETIEVLLAAAVRWPRGKGDELRTHGGKVCGTFNIDWALAYRQSEHELNGEIELQDPAILHLTLPKGVSARLDRAESVQESIFAMT